MVCEPQYEQNEQWIMHESNKLHMLQTGIKSH